MRKLLVEFIGTFFLVLTVGLVVLSPESGVLPPLAIGGVLVAMLYAGGHISGAHYNPAVTLAVVIRGKCPPIRALGYIAAQVLASLVAALAVKYMRGAAEAPDFNGDLGKMMLAEALFTFALAYTVLNVATAKGTEGNSYFGLAIGLVVLVGAFAVGDISGAVFNPAVAVGLCVMNLLSWGHIWIYLAATFAGGLLAGLVFCMLEPDGKS